MPTREELRVQEKALARTFGQRLREARDMMNWGQLHTAKEMGYANPSGYSKLEAAATDSIPLWALVRAAELMDISTDWLLGLSADWERDASVAQQRDVYRLLRAELQSESAKAINERRALRNRVEAMQHAVSGLVPLVIEIQEALARFRALNPEYDDQLGGAKLAATVERADTCARMAQANLKRFRAEGETSASYTDPDPDMLTATLRDLAKLSELEYDQIRVDRASRLGIRVKVLDRHVAVLRKMYGSTSQLSLFEHA